MSLKGPVRFSAVLEELPHILLWIRQPLLEAKVDPRWIQQLELAAEEAIVNVIRYAYPKEKGEVEVRLAVSSQGIELTLRDRGSPFNPLTDAPPVDIQSPLEERGEGGLGVFLMRQCVDELHYQREQEGNVLTLIKRFSRKK